MWACPSTDSVPTTRSPAFSSRAHAPAFSSRVCVVTRGRPISEHDVHLVHAEGAGDVDGDAAEVVLHAHALQERRGDTCQQRRLPLALLGLGRPSPRSCGELADDDRRHEVDGERDPVLSVRERERIKRFEEEEVEGKHARDGDRDRVRHAPDDSDGYDGEDIKRTQAEHGRPRVEKRDRDRDDRDAEGACDDAGQPEPEPRIHREDNGTVAAWRSGPFSWRATLRCSTTSRT